MNAVLSPWTLGTGCVVIILGLLASPNSALWATCLLALPLAVWLLGGQRAYRVLLWVVAVNWLQVIGDVMVADVAGETISESFQGTYRAEAILWSLCAILVLALGMRWGTQLGGRLFRSSVRRLDGSPAGDERSVRLKSCLDLLFCLARDHRSPRRSRRFCPGAYATGSRPQFDQIRLCVPHCRNDLRIGTRVRFVGRGLSH